MNGMAALNGYWKLVRWLVLPERYHYWLFMFSLMVSIVTAISGVSGLLNGHIIGVLVIVFWAIVFTLWFSISLLMMHGQLLLMASNRQLYLLPGVRIRALTVYWLVITAMAVLLTVGQWVLMDTALSITGFVFNWSLCVLASVVFLWCLTFFSTFALLVFWGLCMLFSRFVWPLELSPWVMLVLALSALIGFSYWWLRWVPAKKYTNIFLMSNWQEFQKTASMPWLTISTKLGLLKKVSHPEPTSLFRYLLYGRMGNFGLRVLIWLLMTGVVLLCAELLAMNGYSAWLTEMMRVLIPITLWGYLCGGLGFFMRLYSNLGRVWLYFPGSRKMQFVVIERYFMLLMLVDLVFICLLASVACYWVYPEYLQLQWVIFYCLLVGGLNWLLFQMAWWLYCRTQGSNNWLGIATFFVIFVQVFVAGLCFGLVFSGSISAQAMMSGVIMFCILSAFLLRQRMLRTSQNMSFSRR